MIGEKKEYESVSVMTARCTAKKMNLCTGEFWTDTIYLLFKKNNLITTQSLYLNIFLLLVIIYLIIWHIYRIQSDILSIKMIY